MEIPKEKLAPLEEELIMPGPREPVVSKSRPDFNTLLARIPNTVTQSLKQVATFKYLKFLRSIYFYFWI